MNKNKAELMAPAGDSDAMEAAVANGADSVYFGLTSFNARRRATNFTINELPEIVGFLHDHNVKAYVTLNTLIFSDELTSVGEHVEAIANAGADAVIVQDLGIIPLIRRMVPSLAIHASTQMTITEPAGVSMVRELGISRVILARELSIDEIRVISRSCDIELEVFIHGALCLSYSGQCLASLTFGGRSSNRGVCAQPCRLAYELFIDGAPHPSGVEKHILSPKDLAASDRIIELLDAGVCAFKIEGRLKNAIYVAAAVLTYRKVLDAALEGRRYKISLDEMEALRQGFSRGFTIGYIDGVRHHSLIGAAIPGNQGIRIGEVLGTTQTGVKVLLDNSQSIDPAPGDGILIGDKSRDNEAQGGRVFSVHSVLDKESVKKGNTSKIVELRFQPGKIDLERIVKGSYVWKTDDPKIRKKIRKSFSRISVHKRIPIDFKVKAEPQSKLQISAECGEGLSATAESPALLDHSIKRPLTLELLYEHLGRLGDSVYKLGSVELYNKTGPCNEASVMAPQSVLNDLRRQIVSAIELKRAEKWRHKVSEVDALQELRSKIEGTNIKPSSPTLLCVLARTMEQLNAIRQWHASGNKCAIIYIDFSSYDEIRELLSHCDGLPLGLAGPRILHPGEEGSIIDQAKLEPAAMLVRNIATLALMKHKFPHIPIVADFSFNAVNELSISYIMKQGVQRVTPGYDLDMAQKIGLGMKVSFPILEIPVYHHRTLFHTRYCLLAGNMNFRNCQPSIDVKPCGKHSLTLKDRKGIDLPVLRDIHCRNTVYHGKPLNELGFASDLISKGTGALRIELLDESLEETLSILNEFIKDNKNFMAGSYENQETC